MSWIAPALRNAAMYVLLGTFLFPFCSLWLPTADVSALHLVRWAWIGAAVGAVVGLIDGLDSFKRNRRQRSV